MTMQDKERAPPLVGVLWHSSFTHCAAKAARDWDSSSKDVSSKSGNRVKVRKGCLDPDSKISGFLRRIARGLPSC